METCCLYTCYRPKKKALFCHAFTLFVPIKHAAIGDSEPSWLRAIALALRWPSANLNSNLSIQLIWNSPPNHDKNGSNSDDIKDLCVWGGKSILVQCVSHGTVGSCNTQFCGFPLLSGFMRNYTNLAEESCFGYRYVSGN